ncbi:unnamed protein product [Chironomus riparius]|uniref:Uncharacterized protein n=1 Tax=Chironomus riparius TaxID=315576 RepID=A0A9N9WSG8_9DIPT|nr:unnamed protein product [Chironomus riparius]
MDDLSSDDILQIYATDQDLSFSDNTKSKTVSSDNVVLKIFTKGANPLPSATELADFLITEKQLDVCGLSFKPKSVLFEISNNSQLNVWLVKLFEERHYNMKLSPESQLDIFRILKGKTNLIIKNLLVFLVVLPGSSMINFPCQDNFHPFGLCNKNITNVCASSLRDDPSKTIFKFLKHRDDVNRLDIKLVYGVRLEVSDDDTHNLRFLLKRSDITNRLLCTLKDLYGPVSFLGSTFHIIPTMLKSRIDYHIDSGREYSNFWDYIATNDILQSEVNEMSIIEKSSKIASRPTNDSCPRSTSNIKPAINKSRIALIQWGLLNGMQGQGNNDQGGFNNSSNSFLSWMNQQNSGGGTGNNPINNDNQE